MSSTNCGVLELMGEWEADCKALCPISYKITVQTIYHFIDYRMINQLSALIFGEAGDDDRQQVVLFVFLSHYIAFLRLLIPLCSQVCAEIWSLACVPGVSGVGMISKACNRPVSC